MSVSDSIKTHETSSNRFQILLNVGSMCLNEINILLDFILESLGSDPITLHRNKPRCRMMKETGRSNGLNYSDHVLSCCKNLEMHIPVSVLFPSPTSSYCLSCIERWLVRRLGYLATLDLPYLSSLPAKFGGGLYWRLIRATDDLCCLERDWLSLRLDNSFVTVLYFFVFSYLYVLVN